jgi:hypothetical protein
LNCPDFGDAMKKGYKKVLVSKSLIEKIEERIKDSEYVSVSDYIEKLIKINLSGGKDGVLSDEDEEKVKDRLKALGYME